ncbi:hypothetical protein LOAG_06454 [Loa loa]|uniref:Tudor domain-containing protein n=1 Tax=Loa loa TaxID=7209 RepID=A0A1S0TXY1_LOALO|nr:hypothetical protein LOAG_06454 [Loa loa]EFO22034.1 hypothetical protein LOAG_06454 [Loa loa]
MRSGGKFLVAAPPDGRALWLRHDGSSINLMASTYFIPAGLVLPADDCFEVRILRVDKATKCLYVRPLFSDNQYDELNVNLSVAVTNDTNYPVVTQPLSMSTVYMVRTEKGYVRAVLLKREKTMTYSVIGADDNDSAEKCCQICQMYGIDLGEVYDICANDVCELLPSLRNVPPLCLCIILESCSNTSKCEEFELLEEGAICIIRICNEFPSNYPQRAKEMYPPAIMSQLYKEIENAKYIEITCNMKTSEKIPESPLTSVTDGVRFSESIESNVTHASMVTESVNNKKAFLQTCTININGGNSSGMPRRRCRALVVKSASVPAITRDPALPFMFQKFNVALPARLTARVTERTDYDTYLMRNPEVIDDLTKRMVTAKTPLISRLCLDRGICCIARLIRPARSSSSSFEPQIYRAIASHYRPDDNTCEVLLVDFGQTIVCSVSNLFELKDQPVEVLEKPTASFRCRVKRFSPSKKNGNKGVRLLDENDYNVCLTLKCARDLYWAKVTLSDTDFVLYYKKPRVRKEVDEKKNVKEETNIDTASQVFTEIFSDIKNTPRSNIVKKLEQRKAELREEEERLHEQEELLRKEEENFTNERNKREQELQLIALQMQLWDISTKLDMVASNNSNFVKANASPQLQEDGYCDIPMHTTNSHGQPGNGYGNGNNAANMPQQQQNIAVNQSWGQQWPSYPPAPQTSSVVTSINQCNQPYPYQQINGMHSSMPYMQDAPVSFPNATNDYHYGIPKCNRNINNHVSPQKSHFPSRKWRMASPKTTRTLLLNDTSSESDNGHSSRRPSSHNNKLQSLFRPNSKIKKRSTQSKAALSTSKTNSIISNSSTDCKFSVSADSFWDSCHRKLEYGEPPHRTISDYCNIAKKQSLDINDNFPKRSLSAISQYTKNLSNFPNQPFTQLKLEQTRKTFGNMMASDSSHTSSIKKPIYTSDESADYSQLCISTSNYEEQDMLVLSESQISMHHQDDEPQSFPTYQLYHKLVSIVDGSELMVRRIGSDADWPIFFVTPATVSQDMSAACFDSLCPTQKLNANEIAIGALCMVQCNDFEKTKVRAVIERFGENVVHVRHIDDGHVGIIGQNDLWSIENLPSNVRIQPALSVPCILASLNEAQLVKTINCHMNGIPCVGQLMRVQFKEQRKDGIWIVELINGMNNDERVE